METLPYALFDRPEVGVLIFHPRRDWRPPPPGATDLRIPVAEGMSVGARLYPAPTPGAPLVLFFHGNGETMYDYDPVAPLYQELAVGLLVADYRGYGTSDGSPTVSALLADAVAVLDYVIDWRERHEECAPLLVMGRSLGSQAAIELALRRADRLKGMVIESGFANPVRLLAYLGVELRLPPELDIEALSRQRLQMITLPSLVIHGDADELIPVEEGKALYQAIGAMDKRLLVVPGAGHNDLLMWGEQAYFAALRALIFRPVE